MDEKTNTYMESKFPNGITSYLETYYEIVSYISYLIKEGMSYKSEVLSNAEEFHGTKGLYTLAEQLTDTFENRHKDTAWEEIDFFETIDEFLNKALYD